MSKYYAHHKNGVVDYRGAVPSKWQRADGGWSSGLEHATDAELKAMGFLPLIEVGITLGENECKDGVDTVISANSITDTARKRSLTAVEIAEIAKQEAQNKITELENSMSMRRIREAINGTDGGWMAALDATITTERNKL